MIKHHSKQHGAALIVSLLLLLMLTIVGVTSLSNTRLGQQMAGNSQDKRLSLHFAEITLREGEMQSFNNILSRNTLNDGIFDHSSGGVLQKDDGTPMTKNPADFFNNPPANEGIIAFTGIHITGNAQNTIDFNVGDATTGKTARIPQYVVENLGQSRIQNVGKSIPKVTRFRVTARGTGLAATTQTFLQSTLGKLE